MKIKEVISRLRVILEENLVQAGHATVMRRIQSYYSQTGKSIDVFNIPLLFFENFIISYCCQTLYLSQL